MSNLNRAGERLNPKIGFNIGIMADFGFHSNMAIQSRLLFVTKGAKGEGSLSIGANYLQLPVHFAYKVEVAPTTHVMLHAGPYITYGIGGKTKYDEPHESVSYDTFGDAMSDFNPSDAGAGLGVGLDFGHFIIDLGWDMSLINIGKLGEDGKNESAYLSVGYKF